MQRSIERARSFWILAPALLLLALVFGLKAFFLVWGFFTLMGLGALLVLLLHNAVTSFWGRPLEPYLYPLARLLPWLGVLGLVLFLDLPTLYPWARGGEDALLAHRASYLNAPFFLLRYALFFVLFTLVLQRLKPGETRATVGAAGLPLTFAAGTFLVFDLFMALEAHFYSASFGALMLLSAAVAALAYGAFRASRAPTPELKAQLTSLTNLLLALSIIWIYVEATTLIIIWGADLPHEAQFYLKRTIYPWDLMAFGVAVGGFLLPFLALLTNLPKRDPRWLGGIALWVLAFRFLHYLWYVLPPLA
ncbi:MAG: hypothetical protein C4300_00785 [Thermus sp.]|uniref:hypothetical protein n=1 Tax=Thermus sp. TaxID=275 RepID=UPI00332BDD04